MTMIYKLLLVYRRSICKGRITCSAEECYRKSLFVLMINDGVQDITSTQDLSTYKPLDYRGVQFMPLYSTVREYCTASVYLGYQ